MEKNQIKPSVFFGIMFLIIENKQISRKELAERFEISTRTVSRYVGYMMLCGIPVFSTTGPKGGYTLPDDFKLERTFLSREERLRLITCLRAAKENFDDDLCAQLENKLAALGAGDENDYVLSSERLIIDGSAWNDPKSYRNKISALTKAVEQNLTIRFTYVDRHETASERFFDPYCLVLKEGLWYVYGWCHTREDFRLFKLARMRTFFQTGETFVRKKSDVYAKLRGDFDKSDLVDFTVEFSNMVLSDIEEWLGLEAISERGTQYIAHARMYGGNVLVGKLLSFGSSVSVLSPPALKEEILVECKRILGNA